MTDFKQLTVIQHTSADYLGLIEEHLEGRRIRFRYIRPFTERVRLPNTNEIDDGLVLLGGGPWGSAGPRNLPTLSDEVILTHSCLKSGKPVIGIGLGAQILVLAAGGKTFPAPLQFDVGYATRVTDDALNGFLPAHYPNVTFLRDSFEVPEHARVLSVDANGCPALVQIGTNAFGFTGHPGFKLAMVEDLLMEFEETPEDPAPTLTRLREKKVQIEEALISIMTGVIQLTGLM